MVPPFEILLPSSPQRISAANLIPPSRGGAVGAALSRTDRSYALERRSRPTGLSRSFSDKAMGLALDALTASVLTGPFLATLLALVGLVRLAAGDLQRPDPMRHARANFL